VGNYWELFEVLGEGARRKRVEGAWVRAARTKERHGVDQKAVSNINVPSQSGFNKSSSIYYNWHLYKIAGCDLLQDCSHQWVSEIVTQYWISMYYNSWNICKATSHCFLDYSSDQGTIIKAKWQLSSICPSSYSTLQTSIASRIRTTTGAVVHSNPRQMSSFDWVRSYIENECPFWSSSKRTETT
jgi:hypothetical protein